MIKYECSQGERVSESTIKKRLSDSYRRWYQEGLPSCAGCGGKMIETSHIIAKARCKQLHLTNLIWTRSNTFPSCRSCHQIWESIANPEWCKLMNVDECLEALEIFDPESYNKRMIIYEAHLQTKANLGLYKVTKEIT